MRGRHPWRRRMAPSQLENMATDSPKERAHLWLEDCQCQMAEPPGPARARRSDGPEQIRPGMRPGARIHLSAIQYWRREYMGIPFHPSSRTGNAFHREASRATEKIQRRPPWSQEALSAPLRRRILQKWHRDPQIQ